MRINGSAYCISLYFTFNADMNEPIPRDNNITHIIKNGIIIIVYDSDNPYKNIKIIKIHDAIQKSTSGAITPAIGIINLGKYTFVIIDVLESIPEYERLTPSLNNNQIIFPDKKNTAYGSPEDGTLIIIPKKMVKIIIVING